MEYKTFETIVNEKLKAEENLTYADKLSSLEWKQKRLSILKRDGYVCTNCQKIPTDYIEGIIFRERTADEVKQYFAFRDKEIERIKSLNVIPTFNFSKNIKAPPILLGEHIILCVHHKYYIDKKQPWEYLNNALITLCQNCHQDLHDQTKIPVYTDITKTEQLNLTKCHRCNGSGYLSQYHYYQNGICFECNGYKYLELIK